MHVFETFPRLRSLTSYRNRNVGGPVMKELILSAVVGLSLSTIVPGMWALVPLDELVAESDLIIVGTLYAAAEDDEGIGKGYIMVDEIVSGRAKTFENRPLVVGNSLKITWADNWACAMGMHMGRANQK